jgi:hypothetical protein
VSRPGERRTAGLRLSTTLFEDIDRRASASGRAWSHECEYILEFAMREVRRLESTIALAYGPELARILRQIGQIATAIGPLASIASTPTNGRAAFDWWGNAYARDKALKGAIAYLQSILPSADAVAALAPSHPVTAASFAPGLDVGEFTDLIIDGLDDGPPEKDG